MLGFCSNSLVNIPHAQALLQNPSAVCRDRINDVPCCVWILRADLTWYIRSCSRSFHWSAPVKLSLKSPSDGNPVDGGTAAVASALSSSTKSVSLSICVSRCCGNLVGAVSLSICVSRCCNSYLEEKEIMINSRWWSSRFGKSKMDVVVRARADASTNFKMARVDASTGFKMAVH